MKITKDQAEIMLKKMPEMAGTNTMGVAEVFSLATNVRCFPIVASNNR
jgi:hypothetical protein